MKLQNKVALVTGASRGIGRAIALLFAREGAKVVINYNNAEKEANEVLEEVKKLSDGIIVKCDVSEEEQVKNMLNQCIERFGKVDILVNNAGIVFDVPLFEKTVEQWRKTLNVNLIGVFLCSKYASEFMTKQNQGVIVNISSTNGVNSTSPESADYDASKSGVISLTKNLAEELAPKVRVNSISPGWIKTDINKDLPEDFIKEEVERTPLKRLGKPGEIASAALFLASDDSSFMTGANLIVDGGYK